MNQQSIRPSNLGTQNSGQTDVLTFLAGNPALHIFHAQTWSLGCLQSSPSVRMALCPHTRWYVSFGRAQVPSKFCCLQIFACASSSVGSLCSYTARLPLNMTPYTWLHLLTLLYLRKNIKQYGQERLVCRNGFRNLYCTYTSRFIILDWGEEYWHNFCHHH